MTKIAVGTRVRANNSGEWTFGLVGKVVKNCADGDFIVEFDRKEAADNGWGTKRNRWYIAANKVTVLNKSDTFTIGSTADLATDMNLGKQQRAILAHLKTGKTITNNESMLVYHVSRLSDVVLKLRRKGYNIETTMKTDAVGGQYASYKLAA